MEKAENVFQPSAVKMIEKFMQGSHGFLKELLAVEIDEGLISL